MIQVKVTSNRSELFDFRDIRIILTQDNGFFKGYKSNNTPTSLNVRASVVSKHNLFFFLWFYYQLALKQFLNDSYTRGVPR